MPTKLTTLSLLLTSLVLFMPTMAGAKTSHHKSAKVHHQRHVKVPMTWDAQMADFLKKCDPSITADRISHLSAKAHEIMANHGIDESELSILSHVNSSIPSGFNIGTHPEDYFAAYLTLRIGE